MADPTTDQNEPKSAEEPAEQPSGVEEAVEPDPIMSPEAPEEVISEELEFEDTPEATAAGVAIRMAELEAQAADYKDKLLRAMAEMENLRRRSEAEKEKASKYAVTNFARDMLNVSDNLARALDSTDDSLRQSNEAVNGLMTGVEMTQKEIQSVFARAGITPVEAEGQRFDSNYHEAMFQVPNPEVPEGTIIQVVQPGYMLADRLLRPAKVGVATGGPKAAPAPAAEAAPEAAGSADPAANADPYHNAGGGQGQNVDQEL
ncbi:MAG: nucleotide exchange factor GrpE [Magnetovibrionaceae bacterium]